LNPGPHGPEICAVSSTETGFEGFELDWRPAACLLDLIRAVSGQWITPVIVLTKEVRSPWVRPGGTTFHFVNDGVESALHQARDIAGGKDIRIAGGAHAIVQYLNAGLVDEFSIAVSPVIFGAGVRLFDGVDRRRISLEILEAINSPMVTHLTYAVRRRDLGLEKERSVSAGVQPQ